MRIRRATASSQILRGEMSFVGPRPARLELVEELTAAIPFCRLQHCVLLSVTGLRLRSGWAPSVIFSVTIVTECDQIRKYVAAKLAPAFHVMDLQVFHGTAFLASPTIPFEHKVSDYCVLLRVQLDPRSFLADTSRIS